MHLRVILLIGLITFTPVSVVAQMTFEEALGEGRNLGNTGPQGKDAANALINQAQSQGVPGLTPEAQSDAEAQGAFFRDNPDLLSPQGQGAMTATEPGQFLQESYNLRPRIVIDPADPLLTFSGAAAGGAGSCVTRRVCARPVTEVITDTRTLTCSIEYAETGTQCAYPLPQPPVIDGNGSGSLCVDHLLYARVHRENGTTYHLQLLDTGPSGDYHRNCGGVGSGGGTDDWHTLETVSLPAPPVSFNFDVSATGGGCGDSSISLTAPDQSVTVTRCGASGAQRPSYTYRYSFVFPPPPLLPETIRGACGPYMDDGNCVQVNEQCTSLSCTRSYLCIDPSRQIDGCGAYRSSPSCALQGSACLLSNEAGQCFTRQETYACTTQTTREGCAEERMETLCPQTPEGIRCLDPNECADTTSTPNSGFPLAASQMGALASVENDHTAAEPVIIFTGSRELCRKTVSGGVTRNCCALDEALIGCNAQEEQLQGRRNAGQCREVGTYCSREVSLGFTDVCMERSTSFCCFSSKLTRIIQEQGRGQLGIGWGSTQSPDCRGLTVEELQRINFEAIDFSEYYADIMAAPPDPNQLTTQTQNSQALIPNRGNVPPPPVGISGDQVQQELDRFFETHAP